MQPVSTVAKTDSRIIFFIISSPLYFNEFPAHFRLSIEYSAYLFIGLRQIHLMLNNSYELNCGLNLVYAFSIAQRDGDGSDLV
jgi:hypothetical protein